MSGLTLYDIEQGLSEALAAREAAGDDPEKLEAAELVLQTYAEAELKKADGYISTIKAIEGAIEARKAERDRQSIRIRALQNSVDWLKQYALGIMQSNDIKRIDGKTGSLVVRNNGGIRPLTITESELPAEYKIKEVIYKADKDKIRAALENGIDVPGARLDERGQSLTIR